MSEEQLKIKITVDDKQVNKAFKNLNNQTASTDKQLKNHANSMKTTMKGVADSINAVATATRNNMFNTWANGSLTAINKVKAAMGDINKAMNSASSKTINVNTGGGAGATALGAAAGAAIGSAGSFNTGSADEYKSAIEDVKKAIADTNEEISRLNSELDYCQTELLESSNAYNDLNSAQQRLAFSTKEGADAIKNAADVYKKQMEDIKAEMGQYATSIDKNKAKQKELVTSLKKLNKELKRTEAMDAYNARMKGMSKHTNSFGKTLKRIVGLLIGVQTIQWAKDGISQVKEYKSGMEALGRVVGEDVTKELHKWANENAKYFGLAKSEAVSTAAFMSSILGNFIDPKDLGQATTQLINQMAIMAAKTGKPMEQIQEAIQSGFLGSFETIENILPTMNKSLGDMYAKTYFNVDAMSKLTDAQKKYIMYLMVMDESQKQYGKTLDGSVVNMNLVRANLKNLKQDFGNVALVLLDTLSPAINFIISLLQKLVAVLRGVVGAFNIVFGGKKTKGVSNDIKDVNSNLKGAANGAGGLAAGFNSAAKAAEKLRKYTMGFDELQIIPGKNDTPSGSGSGGISGGGAGGDIGGGLIPPFDTTGLEEVSSLAMKVQEALVPLLTMIKEHLPIIIGIGAAIAGIVGFFKLFTEIIPGIITAVEAFKTSWALITPLFTAFGAPAAAVIAIIGVLVATIVGLWKKNEEFRESWKQVWENICETLQNLWDNILKPIFDALVDVFKFVWEEGVKPLWDAWLVAWGEISGFITDVLNRLVFPVLNVLIKILGPVLKPVLEALKIAFKVVFTNIYTGVKNAVELIGNIFKGMRQMFNGIIDFITGVFTGNWKKAWEGVKSIFKGIIGSLGAIFKAPINAIVDGLNTVIKAMNKMKVPDWVPKIGGKGVNIPLIPRLAKGGVIDGPRHVIAGEDGKEAIVPLEKNTEWMDVLADRIGGNKPQKVTMKVDSRTFGEVVIGALNEYVSAHGELPIYMG